MDSIEGKVVNMQYETRISRFTHSGIQLGDTIYVEDPSEPTHNGYYKVVEIKDLELTIIRISE